MAERKAAPRKKPKQYTKEEFEALAKKNGWGGAAPEEKMEHRIRQAKEQSQIMDELEKLREFNKTVGEAVSEKVDKLLGEHMDDVIKKLHMQNLSQQKFKEELEKIHARVNEVGGVLEKKIVPQAVDEVYNTKNKKSDYGKKIDAIAESPETPEDIKKLFKNRKKVEPLDNHEIEPDHPEHGKQKLPDELKQPQPEPKTDEQAPEPEQEAPKVPDKKEEPKAPVSPKPASAPIVRDLSKERPVPHKKTKKEKDDRTNFEKHRDAIDKKVMSNSFTKIVANNSPTAAKLLSGYSNTKAAYKTIKDFITRRKQPKDEGQPIDQQSVKSDNKVKLAGDAPVRIKESSSAGQLSATGGNNTRLVALTEAILSEVKAIRVDLGKKQTRPSVKQQSESEKPKSRFERVKEKLNSKKQSVVDKFKKLKEGHKPKIKNFAQSSGRTLGRLAGRGANLASKAGGLVKSGASSVARSAAGAMSGGVGAGVGALALGALPLAAMYGVTKLAQTAMEGDNPRAIVEDKMGIKPIAKQSAVEQIENEGSWYQSKDKFKKSWQDKLDRGGEVSKEEAEALKKKYDIDVPDTNIKKEAAVQPTKTEEVPAEKEKPKEPVKTESPVRKAPVRENYNEGPIRKNDVAPEEQQRPSASTTQSPKEAEEETKKFRETVVSHLEDIIRNTGKSQQSAQTSEQPKKKDAEVSPAKKETEVAKPQQAPSQIKPSAPTNTGAADALKSMSETNADMSRQASKSATEVAPVIAPSTVNNVSNGSTVVQIKTNPRTQETTFTRMLDSRYSL